MIILPPRDQRRSKKQQNADSVFRACINPISAYTRLYPQFFDRGSLGSAGFGGEGSGLEVFVRRVLDKDMQAGMG